jgi:hypothetical protein
MHLIVEMRFGSHLYGTATPRSDTDTKAVYLPCARDILLQRVRPTLSASSGSKNARGDTDAEIHSLQRYLALLTEGQTIALDMLFAPDWAMLRTPDLLWREVQANTERLVSRRASVFVRYCRQQANKYGLKGSRVAAARLALAVLTEAERTRGTTARLAAAEESVAALVAANEHTALVDLPSPGGQLIRHLEVCGKKMPFTSSVKTAREVVQKLVEEYGERALQAERNDGADWKALSHAVRVAREAIELFSTGRITFPLASAPELLAIKTGEVDYATVAATIDRLLPEVEAAAARSTLPDEPDLGFIDDLVARAHRARVIGDGP